MQIPENAKIRLKSYVPTVLFMYTFLQLLMNSTLWINFPELNDLLSSKTVECLVLALCLLTLIARQKAVSRIQVAMLMGFAPLLVSMGRTGDNTLLMTLSMLTLLSDLDEGELCRSYCIAAIAAVIVGMILSVAGVIYNRDDIPNDRLVFSYGFGHPNTLGALLISLCGALVYTLWDSRLWPYAVFCSGVSGLFAKVALSSNTAMVLCLAIAAFAAFGHSTMVQGLSRISRRKYSCLLVLISLVLLILMLVLTASYDGENAWMALVNKLIHNRPLFAHRYYESYGGFTLLGRAYQHVSSAKTGLPFTSVDSGYSYMALVHGMACLTTCCAVFIEGLRKRRYSTGKELYIWSVAVLYLLNMLVEPFALSLSTCFAIIFLARVFASESISCDEVLGRRRFLKNKQLRTKDT